MTDPRSILNVSTGARYDPRAANLIGSSWRRRNDGWIADVDYSTGGGSAGPGVHLVAKEGEEAAGLEVPLRILLKAFDRMRLQPCRRCHQPAWRFDEGPGHYRYARHGCAAARRAYLLAEKGKFKERCRRAPQRGWWSHPLAPVIRRRSRKLLGTRQPVARLSASAPARDALESGSWLVGAIYAMSANGAPHATIAAETGLRGADVALVLAWADAVCRRAADRTFRRRRR